MPRSSAPKKPRRGAQPGNKNAATHGFYSAPSKTIESIDDVIADLREKQAALSGILDKLLIEGDADRDTVIKLFALHAQNANRLGRLLRDQRALSGKSADGISAAIAQAISELSTEWGVEI